MTDYYYFGMPSDKLDRVILKHNLTAFMGIMCTVLLLSFYCIHNVEII